MSYANATVSPAARLRAVSGTIAVHALLGAGVVLGLTFTGVIAPPVPNPTTVFLPDPPPPSPDVIEDQPETTIYQPPTAPDPIIRIDDTPPDIIVDPPRPDIIREVIVRPNESERPGPANPPTPLFDPVGPVPRNGPAGWITNDDYPRVAITRELEGTTGYNLVIGSDGQVDDCQITRSSGHSALDAATCRLIERRARFDAAKDNRGRTVVGTFTGQVTWDLND